MKRSPRRREAGGLRMEQENGTKLKKREEKTIATCILRCRWALCQQHLIPICFYGTFQQEEMRQGRDKIRTLIARLSLRLWKATSMNILMTIVFMQQVWEMSRSLFFCVTEATISLYQVSCTTFRHVLSLYLLFPLYQLFWLATPPEKKYIYENGFNVFFITFCCIMPGALN